MNLCAIQSPYPYTLAEADDAVEFLIRELDRCDSSADLILLPEYSNAPTVFPEGECIPYAAAHTEGPGGKTLQCGRGGQLCRGSRWRIP